jgi:hypothetical protein
MNLRKFIAIDGTEKLQVRTYDLQTEAWSDWRDVPTIFEDPTKSIGTRVVAEAAVSLKGHIDIKMGSRLMPLAGKKVRIIVEEIVSTNSLSMPADAIGAASGT